MAERDFKVKNGIEFGGDLSSNTAGFSFDYASNALSVGGSAIALQANVDTVSNNVTSNFSTINGYINTVNSNVIVVAADLANLSSDLDTVSSNTNTLSIAFTDFATYSNSTFTTNAHIDTKIAELVDSAPGALDTLNELAAALGDDPNFATTITTSIGTISSNVNTVSSNVDTLSTAVDTVTANVNTVSSNVSALINGSTAFTGEVEFEAGINTAHINLDSVANVSGEVSTGVGITPTPIFSFAGSLYRGAELTLLVQDITATEYQISKILVIHDGNSVYTTEYGVLHTGAVDLNSFSATIDGSDVVTLASSGGSANKKISVVSSLLIQ